MTLRDLWLRVRALVKPRQVEHELDDELAFHIECETRKLVAGGLDPVEAVRQARARFGSRTAIADDCRDERGIGGLESLWRDLAYAGRTFRRAPLVTMTVIVTLTLGQAMATTAFTVFNAIFLRVDAVHAPGELFAVRRPVNNNAWVPFTVGDYEAFSGETTPVFSGTTALTGELGVRLDGRLVKLRLVTGSFFQLLGAEPVHGRALTPSDDRPDVAPSVVLSDRGWKTLFQRDAGVIGRRIRINGADVDIVGIMPDAFFGLAAVPPDFWGPLATRGQFIPSAGKEADPVVEVVGRMKPDVPAAAALDSLRRWAAGPGLKRAGPRTASIELRRATGLTPEAFEAIPAFAAISTAFWLVLLIACANVANLLLARGLARQQEIGIRVSLGASRRRVVRQLLTENFVLALAGSAGAYPLARVLMEVVVFLIAANAPPEMAEQLHVAIPSLDWHVLAFLMASAAIATALFGVFPALRVSRVEPVRVMQGESRPDLSRSRARHALIAVQVGASALLLIATATFLRATVTAAHLDPRLRTDSAVMVSIVDEARRRPLLGALSQDPDISRIAAASPGNEFRTTIARAASTGIQGGFNYQLASRDYFEVIGMPVIRGRGFTPAERNANAAVVLVSERAAKRLWPGREPVGQVVRLSLDSNSQRTFIVAGIVHTPVLPMRDSGMDADVYVPADLETPGTELAVTVRDDPFRARSHLIERLGAIDPRLGAVTTLRTKVGVMAMVMGALFALGVALGGLALLLTVSGLFGVLSYTVERRSREIGLRMALGASGARVVRLVLAESGLPVGIGLAAGGLLAAVVAGALAASPLAGEIAIVIRMFDPTAYAASLLVIVLACGLAASLPALRAVRIDPCVMLRRE